MDHMGNASCRVTTPTSTSVMFTSAAGKSLFATLLISFATFNIRGLGSSDDPDNNHSKREQLGTDCLRYGVDICAIQETKVVQPGSCNLSNGYKLFWFEQKEGRHYGLGFVISPRLIDYVVCWKSVSDRVSYLDLELPTRSGKLVKCRVVNVYGPHKKLALENPQLLVNFYGQVRDALDVPSNVETFMLGDFNSKLGRMTNSDRDFGFSSFMGNFGMGTRNEMGEHLLNFLSEYDLFATNTGFCHPARHTTTYTGWRKDWSAGRNSKKTLPVYSQIDFILCRSRSKPLLKESRSYAGTLTYSDHRLVVTRVSFKDICLCYKRHSKSSLKFNTSELTSNTNIQVKYRQSLDENLSRAAPASDPNEDLNSLLESMKDAAVSSLGVLKHRKRNSSDDDEVKDLSCQRHLLRQQLNSNQSLDRTKLRSSINRLTNRIQQRLSALRSAAADAICHTISSTTDSRKMFEAVRTLNRPNVTSSIGVHDEQGCLIATDTGKATVVAKYLEQQLTRDEPPLEPFLGPPRPLVKPFTSEEISNAARSLKNGRANGPDGIPNELLKYSSASVHRRFADIINRSFETNSYLDPIGQANITPLQKPNKPIGPVKNLRPLTLSNAVRKILSMATLKRIEGKVNAFTGPWQCAYKQGRSCADIVWCQRVLLSVVQRKKWEYHRMGIDMSSAFDTIRRSSILDLLVECGCDDDEIRLVRLLLSNTKLRVNVNGTLSAEFQSFLGAFQGDCLSGCLFTLVLAGALRDLRTRLETAMDRPNPPITEVGLPLDTEYADDIDFNDEDEDNLRALLPLATAVLKDWNLFVNEDKTDFTHVYLAARGERDDQGNPLAGHELWRKSITLGSMLCSKEDISRRISLGYAAFNKYKKAWSHKIPLSKRLLLYEALVVSVLMYNSSCWAAPKSVLEKLDVVHRRHLRSILNYRYPNIISNMNLYKRCNAEPLSARVDRSRWRMLGHVLRGPIDGPAYSSLVFAVNTLQYQGRRGRPQSNLFSLILHDLSVREICLNNLHDLNYLRYIAQDRAQWRRLQQSCS